MLDAWGVGSWALLNGDWLKGWDDPASSGRKDDPERRQGIYRYHSYYLILD